MKSQATSPTKKPRVLSGVQPSGTLHIGNYLGAIKQFVELQHEYEAFFCVVDLHAITVPQDPDKLHAATLEVAAAYLAAGVDPKKSTIFIQSHVPAHAELGWILNTITPLGELERMTQFKDKMKAIEDWEDDKSGIYAGLFNYPTLMAADILLYQTDVVPVGDDQLQHIELTRSLAERFNNRFGNTFRIPKPMIRKETSRVMGLDDPTKKMSKSASSEANYIALTDPAEVIRKKIKTAVTDSGMEVRFDVEGKPGISNLLAIFSEFSGHPIKELEREYDGKTYAVFKNDLAELLVEKLKPFQQQFSQHLGDKGKLMNILQEGAEHADEIASGTLRNVKERMGFVLS